MTTLSARSLHVVYGERTILRDVELDVRAGELLTIVGPNGAGKSTLLRVLSGVVAPTSGEVVLDGSPLKSLSRAAIARSVAVVAQELPTADGFTVRDVVSMGRAPHQGAWMRSSPRDEDIVDRAIARLQLGELRDRPFDALSGGERKRVTIALALAQAPRVLLLDEPSAFLDLRHTLEVFELAREEALAGAAVAVVVHDLAIASRFADRVALVADGAIAAIGTPAEVLDEAHLARTFGVRIRRLHDPETGADAFAPVR